MAQDVTLLRVETSLCGFEQPRQFRVFELDSSDDHLCHAFRRKEYLRHSMSGEPGQHELARVPGNAANMREAIG